MTSDHPLRIAIFGESYLPYLSGVTVSTEALAFTRLHRLSSLLNGASMLAGVLGLVAVGLRR